MQMLKISQEQAKAIFKNLSLDYKLIAPVEKAGEGMFSDTNLVTYDEINSFEDIEFFKKTRYCAKSVLFPVRETMFKFLDSRIQEREEEILPSIIFLRACDINAISITDMHFLKDSRCQDNFYKRRREKARFFLLECNQPLENCFCVSMGTNRTDEYCVFMRETSDGYEIKVRDEDMEKYFNQGKPCGAVEPKFVEQDTNSINLPEKIPVSIFSHKIWKEYSDRCIACGRCNVSCPTCTCFTIQDVCFEDNEEVARRQRSWSSCQVKKFALLAGNHDFRAEKGDRLRYRVLHKIYDFKKRTGRNMCVGCGRCDDVCPEYISMFKAIEKINEISLGI